jgi:branched-chain amino acid transport system substrate-binding protein
MGVIQNNRFRFVLTYRATGKNEMTQRATRWIALVAGAGLAALMSGCGPSIPDTVKIGVAATLSGPSGSRGEDLVRGAKLAADELNAAGFSIGGKRVTLEIVPKDDKADPETAKRVAQQLLDEKVSAVIGHVNTPLNQAVIPVYATQKLPQIMGSTTASLLGLGQGNVFRMVANDDLQSQALAVYASESLKAQHIAVIVETTDYGRDMFEGVRKRLEASQRKVALRLDVDYKAKVTSEMAQKIKAANADAVICIGREAHVVSLVQKLAEAGISNIPVLGANPAKTSSVAQEAAHPGGLYVTSTTVEPAELPGGRVFLETFRAKYKADPIWGAHYAYDAVLVLADAMQDVKSVEHEAVIERMKKKELRSKVFDNWRFNAAGEQQFPTIGIYYDNGGRWEVRSRSMQW